MALPAGFPFIFRAQAAEPFILVGIRSDPANDPMGHGNIIQSTRLYRKENLSLQIVSNDITQENRIELYDRDTPQNPIVTAATSIAANAFDNIGVYPSDANDPDYIITQVAARLLIYTP